MKIDREFLENPLQDYSSKAQLAEIFARYLPTKANTILDSHGHHLVGF